MLFLKKENDLVAYHDIDGLMKTFHIEYIPNEWRLFIGSWKLSLKGILLHIGNKFPPVPIGYAVYVKETYLCGFESQSKKMVTLIWIIHQTFFQTFIYTPSW